MIIIKRILLLFYGPLVFLFIAFAPVFCGHKRGFRRWYWRTLRRSIGWLMDALSIKVEISEVSRARLAADVDSVIAVNHKSNLDVLALMVAIPNEKWVTFSAKKELAKMPFFKGGIKGAGIILVDRENVKSALGDLIVAVAKQPRQCSLILFPEGTRTRAKGLGSFKAGAILIARRNEKTIRPICILNSDKLMPPKAFYPRPGTIRVEVLDSYQPQLSLRVRDDADQLQRYMSTAYDSLSDASRANRSAR